MWDINKSAVEAAVERYPQAPVAASLQEICDDDAIKAVIVATPPDSHHEIGLTLMKAGKNVLMEKPLAPSFRECRDLVAAASDNGVRLAVGHTKRFHPTFRLVREIVNSGQIGVPFFIGVHWATDVKLNPNAFIPISYENYWWRWKGANIGGGIGQDHIPHYVDLARIWTGAEPRRVLGHNMNVARDYLKWLPEESLWEDFSLTLVELDTGCVLRLETGVVGRSISPLLGTGHGSGEWTEYAYILGTEGKLLVDLPPWDASETGRIALWRSEAAARDRQGWTLIEQPEPNRGQGSPSGTAYATSLAQMAAFQEWMADPAAGPSDLAIGPDGAASVAVIEAAYLSDSLGRWIEIAEITGKNGDA